MKKLFRNSHWSKEDKLLAGVAVVAGVGLFLVAKQRSAAAVAPSGVGGLRGLGVLGLGEYFTAPLGAYYNDPVVQQIKGLGAYRGV